MIIVPDGHAGHHAVAAQPARRPTTSTQVFFDDVARAGRPTCVGGENHGWKLITNQLNHERVTLCASGVIDRALTEVTQWAQETKLPDGRRVIDQPWVQLNLAKLHAKVEVRAAHELAGGVGGRRRACSTSATAPRSRCSAPSSTSEGYQLLMEILGAGRRT